MVCRGGVVEVCVGAWDAIGVGISRSALLSRYLGKSGHLPRCNFIHFFVPGT